MGQTFHVEAMLGANASQFDAVMQKSKGEVEKLGSSAKGAGAGFLNLSKDLMNARGEVDALMKVGTQFLSAFKASGAVMIGAAAISSIAAYRDEVRKANEDLRIQLDRRGELAKLAPLSGHAKEIAGLRLGQRAEMDTAVNNMGFLDMVTGAADSKLAALRRVQRQEENAAIVGKNIEAGATAATMENSLRFGEQEAQIMLRQWSITREINDARKQGLTFLADQLERQKAAQAYFDTQARTVRWAAIRQSEEDTGIVKRRAAGGSQDEMEMRILQSKLAAQKTLAAALLDEKDKAAARLAIAQTQLAIEEKRIAIAERIAGITERQANARSTAEGYTKQWEESQNRLDRINKMLEQPNLSKEKRTELETQREEENRNRLQLYRGQTREQMDIFGSVGMTALQNKWLRSGGTSLYNRANMEEDWGMKTLREKMEFETDPTAKAKIGAQLMGAQQSALDRLQGVAPVADSLARVGGGGIVAQAPNTAARQIEIQQSMDATLKLILGALNNGGGPGGNSFVLPPSVN